MVVEILGAVALVVLVYLLFQDDSILVRMIIKRTR